MTPPVRLTPRAVEDLREIGRYTVKVWGKAKRDLYLRALDSRFAWLAENPLRGRPRADIAQGYHSFPHASHVIFYLIRDGGVDIIGVVHQAMDIAAHMTGGDS